MKHKILSKQSVGNSQYEVSVELLPDTQAEATAIRNVQQAEGSEQERAFMDNYLNFNLNLGSYSIVRIMKQQGRHVTLRIVT
ncbi:hypothetical protein [Hymenobacter cheonanensis]|uniref:hypothetical protein n=1 Tax=Hymenobacter sp. CA2-7 TaxID=3063993 RepID=UPI002713446A|nr:hypothetical protein [Hymenobacter sp. CA2-7]MDO7887842.1 hypothetical protein [Hymenobacter sp. CA2-7]